MNKRVAMYLLTPIMTEVLDNGGDVTFTITGNSMLPLLRHRRDKVCIVKPASILHKYDIILFVRGDGKYILHRIIAAKKKSYKVIGDNQCTIEYPVYHSQVIGVVKGIWRKEKYIACDSYWYKAYCRLWLLVYPLRYLYLRVRGVIACLSLKV